MKSTDITNIYMGDTQGQKLFLGDELVWPVGGPVPPGPTPTASTDTCFTIQALESGNLNVKNAGFRYSINGGEWQTTTTNAQIPLTTGDEVRFWGDEHTAAEALFTGNTLAFNVYGNVQSLSYYDWTGHTAEYEYREHANLFSGCTGLVDASNLLLPATGLTSGCYEAMFYGCTSLVNAPSVLPATTLADLCYYGMFYGCTSLVNAPVISGTQLASYSCGEMFNGCASLVNAQSVLPATALTDGCYQLMFAGCTSLTTAPELPAIYGYSAEDYYMGMFSGCTSLNYVKCLQINIDPYNPTGCTDWMVGVAATGTFVKNPNTQWVRSANGIPSGWTVVANS